MKHVFLEQRKTSGVEENEVAVTFKGPRVGLASLLATAGSGGAAEYLSSDAVAADMFRRVSRSSCSKNF